MEQGLVKLEAILFSEKKHYTSVVLSSEFLCVTLKKTNLQTQVMTIRGQCPVPRYVLNGMKVRK